MKRLITTLVAGLVLLGSVAASAQPSAIPPNILAANNLPMVMLSASKDFTMFWKAYTDFDDINFDGAIDRTYMPSYKYYGYFDPTKCYTYNSGWDAGSDLNTGFKAGAGRFEPKYTTSIQTITVAGKSHTGYYCAAGASEWSGNFLNWVSMSRIDVLRKVLYGGLRAVDKTGNTTLELSFVPRNSQSFVKYYNGGDLPYLTAYNSNNAKKKGLTFCRRPAENTGTSHVASFLPEIRVAVGNVILWNMTEVRTCNWSGEINYSWQADTVTYLNNNYETPAGTYASSDAEHSHLTSVPTFGGENAGFVGRVQACHKDFLGSEKCKNYGNAVTPQYKPVGLLQEFGESLNNGSEPARAEFGLMMGSYDNNLQGGVLRKNMSQLNDEIDSATGVFLIPTAGTGGIIRSFNEMTLYDYDVNTGHYTTTSCPSDKRYSDVITNGNCPSWGNPVGELLLESMRYFAGKTALYTKGSKDDAVGLPAVTTWTDPLKDDPDVGTATVKAKRSKLYGQAICRPLNMLTVTSGSNSYDDNSMSALSDLGATSTAADLTTVLGSKEGINGTVRLIGESGAAQDRLCTGKTVTALGEVKGICADGPNFRGTYLGAGVAYYANTNSIRTDITSKPADLPGNALKVRNYGVSMSGGVATISIPTADGKAVYITPASQDQQGSKTLPGNLVDFKVIKRTADGKSGSALVLWQHNMLGEDQDQDMLGVLRWEVDDTVTPWQVRVYTRAVESNTGSSAKFAFGYTLVGTTHVDGSASDGVHFHSGINSAATTEATGTVQLVTGAVQGTSATDSSVCGGRLCSVVNGFTTRGETYKTYKMVGNTDALIREPLWFISKYGGFKYDGKKYTDLFPTSSNTPVWDTKRADGKACGGSTGLACSDGEPDNYFVARSPELLESSLREILEDIVNSSNTAPAIASSELRAGDLKYVASFDSGDGRGEIAAYALNATTGLFSATATWKAHELLKAVSHSARQVITNNGAAGGGVPFQWDSLNTTQKNVLRSGITDSVKAEAYAKAMLNWLRGDTSDTAQFRVRAASTVLGPIVNSNPTVQVPPNANYFGTEFSGYSSFVNTWKNRTPLLWVGAGDGMLHAFDATSNASTGGTPVMSYVPDALFSRLPDWASASKPKVQAFVDGSPFIGDVKIGTEWATYLFSSLGRGGKAIFALDVTDPAKLKEITASSVFKWQFTDADDGDLGYVLSEPTVSPSSDQPGQLARLNNGKFAALFGNGVMSSTGRAVLYILFADGPSSGSWSGRYVKLVADTGTGNGLSTPSWVDVDNDGIADYIYAGDLKGNLWKFDVRDPSTANWKVAYNGLPLFQATDGTNALPITSAPEYRFHPLGGVMLSFGTGKSVSAGDFPNTSRTHAIFGIWDKPAFAAMSSADLATNLPIPLSLLKDRTFNNIGSSTTERYITGDAIDWTSFMGWKLPFNVASEMSISNAANAAKEVIIITVSPPAPKANASDPDPCFAEPQARLTAIDALTGFPEASLLGTVTITVGSTTITVSKASTGIKDQKLKISSDSVGVGPDPACKNGTANCYRGSGATEELPLKGGAANQRVFWREIPGLKTRDWTK
jgi:type IV pilus assembly protein PilY1